MVSKADQFDRFLIATDTPTGSGIMPLGMMYTISHLASLTDMPVEWAIAAATGNNARGLPPQQRLSPAGRDADVVILDACVGGSKDNALDACATATSPRCRRWSPTAFPVLSAAAAIRRRRSEGARRGCKLPRDFSRAAH